MDHSVANLMDYPATPILTRTIECNFTSKAKEEALTAWGKHHAYQGTGGAGRLLQGIS
jgi:hypothetical protein